MKKKGIPRCPTCEQPVEKRTAAVALKLELARKAKRKREKKSGKYEARRAVYWAVKLGMISKEGCADHGTTDCQGKIEAHHHKGYTPDVWLDVVWVCRRHHQQREWEPPPNPKSKKSSGPAG